MTRPVSPSRTRPIFKLFSLGFVFVLLTGAIVQAQVHYPMAPSGWFCTQQPGWNDADVGPVGVQGSASSTNGVFTVSGSGSEIYGTSDAFHFVYQRLYGDGNIVARVVSTQGGAGYANAGVMIRETLDAGSTNAKVAYWLSYGGFSFDARTSTGGSTAEPGWVNSTPPYWVEVVRSGNTFTGYGSADGVNWTQMGPSQTISMAQSVYIGLVVASGSNSTLATATFDNISTSSDTPVPCISSLSATTGDIGSDVTITGSGFGSAQGNSEVILAGTAVTVNSWSDTSIDITIPEGATSGNMVVYVPEPALGIADAESNLVQFTVTTQPLPSGWVDADIGSVNVLGSATYLDGVFTLNGAGLGTMNGGSDAFHFVYQPLTGDGTIVARVVSLPAGSQAGVMIRETLNAAAMNGNTTENLYSSSFSVVYYYARNTTGGGESYAGQVSGSVLPPYWLKLVRSGSNLTSYGSADGVNWTQAGPAQTIAMAQNVFVGLVVSSENASSLATATFDNVSVTTSSVVAPAITGVSTTTGSVGSQVVITGTGFGATQGNSLVTLNQLPMTISSWSDSSITITIAAGTTTGYLVVSLAPDMDDSNPVWFTVTAQPLPSGWLDQDVGTVGMVGSATYSGGVFTVNGAGFGTQGGSSDAFHFVYQPLTGDGTIVARVVSLPAGSQAGVMIRETLNAAAVNGNTTENLYSSSFAVVYYYSRTTTGGSESYAGQVSGSVLPPYWVKLVRSGNNLTSYGSADGVNWTQAGPAQTIAMAQNVFVGFVVSSENTSSLATATFDNVSVTTSSVTAPVITGVSATTGNVGSQVVITGTGFGATQGSSLVSLNELPMTISSWSDSSITITIAAGATTGYLVVSLAPDMDDSNPVWFTVTAQPLPSGWLDQDVGTVGMVGNATYSGGVFTVNGAGLGTQGGSSDGFHFVYQPLSGDGTIVARVVSLPAGSQAGVMVRETLNAAAVNGNMTENLYSSSFSVVYYYSRTTTGGSESYAGQVTGSVLPPYWVKLVRSGNNLTSYGSADGVNWTQAGPAQTITMAQNVFVGLMVSSENTSSLATATFDNVSLNPTGQASTPTITGLSPNAGAPGVSVTITGTNFGATEGTSTVTFNGTAGTPTSWSATSITVPVPTGATSGNVVVTVGGVASNGVAFTVVQTPTITSLSSTSGTVGTPVTITGANFGAAQGTSTVTFNGAAGTPTNWSDTSISVPVPSGATSGNVVVTVNGTSSSGVPFTVLQTPTISTLSASAAAIGASVTITGTNFGSSQGTSTVTFNGTAATPTSWSAISIVVPVPLGATSGPIVVTVNGVASNGASFTVAPNITGISPSTAAIGTTVTIAGTNFGATQGTSTVTFNGTPATAFTNWSSASIVTTVPAGATTGNVVVTVGGAASNGVGFTVAQAFIVTGSLATARMFHTAILLNNGTVLVAGGVDGFAYDTIATAALYNPATGAFNGTGSLNTGRIFSTATLLTSGQVLVAGGSDSSWNQIGTAELYQPASGTFSFTGSLNTARTGHTATLLNNGQVLMVGGWDSNGDYITGDAAVAELYDPGTGSFLSTGSLNTARDTHTATLLNDGTVLIAGGFDSNGNTLASAEIYDPVAGTFSSTGSLNVGRAVHTATLLNNGMVLVAGGYDINGNAVPSAELYNPATGNFTVTGSLNTPRYDGAQGTLLSNGLVLLAGGQDNNGNTLASAELYDPATGNFTLVGNMNFARQSLTTTLVTNGQVLTAAGMDSSGHVLNSAELYQPVSMTPPGLVSIAVTPSSPSVSAGVMQRFTATGTFSDTSTQTLASVIWTSSDNTIVTITNDAGNHGNAVAVGAGSATVTACAGSVCGSTTMTVTVLATPSIVSLSSTAGPLSAPVTITGTNFGLTQGSSTVTFNGATAIPTSWSPTAIAVPVPSGATSGPVVVTVNGISSNAVSFTVLPPPTITSLSPAFGSVGTPVVITGTNFGATQGTSTVTFNGTAGTPTNWSAGSVVVAVPTEATTGSVVVVVGGMPSNAVNFTVIPAVTGVSPTSGTVGTLVTIAGTGFGTSEGTGAVTFNGITATPISWSVNSVTAAVPPGATTGNLAVTVDGVSSNGITFTVKSGGFVATAAPMQAARYGQTATQLTNGQILIAGGMNNAGIVNSAELYTLASQTFTFANTMNVARWLHTATLLNDGTVLIVGGADLANEETLDSAEIYRPTTGTFSLLTATLNTARVGHTATLLDNGQVLIVGGYDPDYGLIADAELYDPPTQTFIDLGDTNLPRYGHTATMLQNGQVLIAGGKTDPIPSAAYNTAELFDPVNQTFTLVPVPMTAMREGHAALLLNSGQVLITGGDDPPIGSLRNAEIYDPSSNTFTAITFLMTVPRIFHAMTLLNGGRVLIAGGATDSSSASVVLNSAELYDPATQAFVPVGNMISARKQPTKSLLNDGTVLITGGTDGTNIFNTAEIYTSSQLNGLTSIAITPSASSIATGGQQLFTAEGTFADGSSQVLASVLWTSSSVTTAPISSDVSNPGVATGSAQGTTTIAASASGATGSATLTVTAPTLISIALSPQDATIPLGTTQQFTATGLYSDGSSQDLTGTVTWGSLATVVIAINNRGLVAGLFQGAATIQASSGSVNASTTVTVGGPGLVSIAVIPTTATVPQGSRQQYQAVGTYSDGSTQDVTTLLTWSSGTPSVATVANTGVATGMSQGTTTLTGTFESLSVSVILTVTPPTLVSVTIIPNVASLSTGTSQQLTATGTYTDGSTQNLTTSSTWVSSNSNVVGVTTAGLVTAIAIGNATITTTSGSTSGTAALTVTSGTTQANLNTGRYQHNATMLNNGQILVAGGINCASAGSCTYLKSAELYNANAAAFASTGTMATPRSAPSVLLNSGKVLIAGGYTCDGSGNCSSLSSAEIYDPVAGTFSTAGSMTTPRNGHMMTVLNNGTVLIAGGQNCTSANSCSFLSSAEIYDPTAGTFTSTANNMLSPRFGASAVLLNSGSALIVGGFDGTNLVPQAEFFDPPASFTNQGPRLSVPRFGASTTLLNDGRILVAGGSTCSLPVCPTNAAEIYDPVAETFTLVAGGMTVPRLAHSATLLTNGQVFLAGGYSSCASTCTEEASSELYDPIGGVFGVGQPIANALAGHTGTLLANGDVLLIGGINAGVTQAADEWYQPTSVTPAGLVSITVSPASLFLPLGQNQQLVATGTFNDGSTQTLQSVIWNSSNPAVATMSNSPGAAGIVNAQATGTTSLTAVAGSISGSASLNVPALVSLTIVPATPSISIGSSQQFTASGTFADNSVHDLTGSATWSTSNISTVLISTATTGLPGYAIGANVGTATITATFGGMQTTTLVTVQAAPVPPSITALSPNSGAAGTQVTITGSGFGSAQGNGSVWLGSSFGTVLSWSNTQIVAAVAPIATTGLAQVQQNGLSSNAVPFNVNTATISTVSPSSGVPGIVVTITGTGFGAGEGSGQVWLGTANGVVQSWSDTQIVAVVALGSTSGNAMVLQNGVMSNPVPFSVNSLHIASVTPNSGGPGTTVTITGTGFGSAQGAGTVWLGSTNGDVMAWSDTQIAASVASNSVTGVVKVEQNGIWSNALTFAVPGGFGGGGGGSTTSVTLIPNVISMLVGETRSIQALDSSGNPVTGLTWTSSNTAAIALSTDDPPILTAMAPGNATITAGNASADLTVLAGVTFPTGTILWSNPGDGSGVTQIVPAVPSATGVADVFSMQADCTVQALASDGTVAWTANIGTYTALYGNQVCNNFMADFQGGLVVYNPQSIMKLDGAAGYAHPAYAVSAQDGTLSTPVVHTDGTIFTVYTIYSSGTYSLVGIEPTTGSQKFGVPISDLGNASSSCSGNACGANYSYPTYPWVLTSPIIAGDGYAYVAYAYEDQTEVGQSNWSGCHWYVPTPTIPPLPSAWVCSSYNGSYTESDVSHLRLLRVGSDGSSSKIDAQDAKSQFETSSSSTYSYDGGLISGSSQEACAGDPSIYSIPTPITNADTGIVFTWAASDCNDNAPVYGLSTTFGGTLASSETMNIPGQTGAITPVLQRQDGNFIGTVPTSAMNSMIAFTSSGSTLFTVPNDTPKIATADNGVIGASGITYDQSGNVTGQTGSTNPNTTPMIAVAAAKTAQGVDTSGPNEAAQAADAAGPIVNSLSTAQSWLSNVYQNLTGQVAQLSVPPVPVATPPNWSLTGANQSGNGTSPRCHDDRDDLIYQYQAYDVRDSYFPKPYPLFRPNCFEETNTAHSATFSFDQLNTNSGSDYALIKNPLVVPASNGYGLDEWVVEYGNSRIINSAYRSPAHNDAVGGAAASRHMLGDAVDLQNQTCPSSTQPCSDAGIEEWVQMVNAAGGQVFTTTQKDGTETRTVTINGTGAKASFIEPQSGPCGLNCAHADWRYKDRNRYVH